MATIARLKDAEISNGNIIYAADLDAEFDQLVNESNSKETRLNDIESNNLTIGGVKTFTSTPKMNAIDERTAASGVTIDGVLLKDSQVTTDVILEKTGAAGVTIDSCLIKDGTVIPALAADPGVLTDGQFWYNTTSDVFKGRINGSTTTFTFLAKTSYESAEQTVTAGGLLALTHSLGGNPDIIEVWMRCKTAEYGFAIGDEVLVSVNGGPTSSGSSGTTVYRTNATQVQIIIGNVATSVYVNRLSATVGNGVGLTNANWRIVVRAVRFA